MIGKRLFSNRLSHYIISVGGVLLTTLLLEPFHAKLNSTTVALAFLLTVLFSATFFGRNPALLSSLLAMLCFNYFFLPPVRTWTISEPQNLVAWGAFTITALIAGELSSYARRRAEEAERLYEELQSAFKKTSQAEAFRQSEKLKSALLDAVTHDLRTPLTSIKASITTLIDNEKSDTFKLDAESRGEFLAVIDEETDRLNHFIEEMVELARIEAGSLALQQNLSAPAEIIEAALSRATPFLQNRKINLLLEQDLPLLKADSKALAEVLYNLLENAAKYAPQDSSIEISVKRGLNEMLEFAVSDEGKGIAKELREKVFEKFFRADDLEKTEHAPIGTGLGLAIAKGIVEAHGGTISVTEGLNNKGAKFIFTVPIGDE